jgi:hypothetical protein
MVVQEAKERIERQGGTEATVAVATTGDVQLAQLEKKLEVCLFRYIAVSSE